MATAMQTINSVDDWVSAHQDASPSEVLAVVKTQVEALRAEARMAADVVMDSQGNLKPTNMGGLFRMAKMYANTDLVPEHFRGKPENCAIAMQMAMRCGVNVMTFLQASYIVHGKPGIEAKLAIAMLNTSGKIRGRIRWRFEGEGKTRSCTALATDADTGEEVSATVTWAMVIAEGWLEKKGSKWATMPDIMFQYRSAMFLCRMNYPDVLMGMYSADELDDIEPAKLVQEARPTSLDDLNDKLNKPVGVRDYVEVKTEPVREAEDADTQYPGGEIPDDANQGTETESTQSQEVDPLAGVMQAIMGCKSQKTVNEVAADVRARHSLSVEQDMRLDSWCQDRMDQLKAK